MAIAFSAIVPVEKRAPANPVAVKGNTVYTRKFRVVIPSATTAAALVIGQVPPGTVVLGAVFDTDTSLAAVTLELKTAESTFIVTTTNTLTVVGGVQQTIAVKKGVISKSTNTEDIDLTLTPSATTPSSEITLDVILTMVTFDENEGYTTKDT
jgi:hypothetical protein